MTSSQIDRLLLSRAPGDSLLEKEAVYFSRRAREELLAGIEGKSRKARMSHLALAEAYELRARILTEALRQRGAAQQCHAL